ncbi:hypothetical protein GCM10011571_14030 [Marinithermofilum abyssi]|uniref:Uncharacterized protein n=1 Tax=Marinithermofilum abyssi TaxID=1571185 RepID=A0A8J2VI70_9BACL|nr:hypothetical protein [Marinithermofilum abyssi]GGE13766.1 hypothetical protein GCM10011571_14030 [Marinithermofilum abyssi]
MGQKQEYQLTSIHQAKMDELANRVRECYQEMAAIAEQVIGAHPADVEMGQSLGTAATDRGRSQDPFHDEEVCWGAGPQTKVCYRKDGGKLVIERES